MDHQDWPGWPEDDPQFEHGFDHSFDSSFDHADADTADLGGHDSGFEHDPLGHDPLGHDPLGHDPLGHDPLGHDPDGPDATHEPGPDLTHEATYEDETPAAGHGHFGAAGDMYPEDDPFAAGHHDEAVIHDGPVVHDDVPADHDSGQDAPLADDHQLVDHPVGADPDLDPRADGDWHDPEFPPVLDLHDAPEPIDGYPWTDPQVLGTGLPDGTIDDGGYHESAWQHPPIGDLYDYAGDEQAAGTDGWHALLSSDDPATSTLARWWTPGS
jgi:hypothetical protein